MDTVINTAATAPAKMELDDSAVVDYKDGASLTVLAKKFGVSANTVSAFLRDQGVTLRGRGRPRKVTA